MMINQLRAETVVAALIQYDVRPMLPWDASVVGPMQLARGGAVACDNNFTHKEIRECGYEPEGWMVISTEDFDWDTRQQAAAERIAELLNQHSVRAEYEGSGEDTTFYLQFPGGEYARFVEGTWVIS